jgi:hypothetical protein
MLPVVAGTRAGIVLPDVGGNRYVT